MPRGMVFDAAAFCQETGYGDRYEVFCNRCVVSIGTMHIVDVTRAIAATLGRGGILCPDCRSVTCDSCGQVEVVGPHEKMEDGTILQLCSNCFVQLRELGFLLTPAPGVILPL